MTIENKIKEYQENLELFEYDIDKYDYIISLGKKLKDFEALNKVEKNLVQGCTSQVWLMVNKQNDKLVFQGYSDAIIVRGLVYMVLDIFSNQSIKDLKDIDMNILKNLNLSEIITPNRQSGLIGMIQKIKEYSLCY